MEERDPLGRQARGRRTFGRSLLLTVALLALGSTGTAVALARDFDHPASNDPYQQYAAGSVQRQDTPNDPQYDNAEPDTLNGKSASDLYDERFDLFGFPSTYTTTTAIYKDPFDAGEVHPDGSTSGGRFGKPQISGYNAAGAWKIERGRPDAVIAILDTGIRWNELGLRRQVHLNQGELPYPETSGPALEAGVNCSSYTGNRYDANGDGAVNVDDYACDPRVSLSYPGRIGPAGLVTGQDLIHAFGHCQINESTHSAVGRTCDGTQHYDNDGNGYANDIAGWNFFDNNNDPTDLSSYFAAQNHGSGRASDAAEAGNDGEGSIGVCPHCQLMPVRVWDTFVSDGNTFGLGMTYATDNGAKVIEGADGNLYHSAFTEAASQYAYSHGVVQTYSGDDLNTANHNYPGNYGHAMLIQGTVPDAAGLGQNIPSPPNGTPAQIIDTINRIENVIATLGVGSNIPTETYFRGANTTQFGGHSSISMEGATGSINTGRASGGAGLVVSAALDHGITLAPDEIREILEQTAERVSTPNTVGIGSPDLAAPPTCPPGTSANAACATPDLQWTEHFGWGRADLGAAVALAASGKIPPQAAIDSPDWFAPLTGASTEITGAAAARFATGHSFKWKLMWAPGLQPTPNSWHTASSGTSSSPVTSFGSIDLNAVRTALASTRPQVDPGGPTYAPGATNPLSDQFTVQLEVSGQDIPTTGIDRRVFTAFSDPSLRAGYPKRLGTGGEAPIRYADLNGDNVPELITPTEDGQVHAYEPSGGELAGWPVHTAEQQAAIGHEHSPALNAIGAPNEPPRAPAIADLDGSGKPAVITAAGIHIYAWHGDGTPVAGFPVSEDLSHCGPALESQALQQRPKCGFLASPTVAHLEGYDKAPDIVEPSLDGWLYAFRADGTRVPNFPVRLRDPTPGNTQIAESINEVAVGNLTGAGHDDIVASTNEEYGAPSGSSDINFYGALASAAGGSTRVYAVDGATGKYLSGWPISIPGIIQNELPLVGPGNDPAIATIGGSPQIITSATGGALTENAPNGSQTRTLEQNAFGPASNATDRSGELNLFEGASVGDLLGTGTPDVVKYGLGLAGAANLLLVGQNVPYNHLIGAFDGSTGLPLPAYPTVTDDYQFLSASNVAKMTAGQTNQVLAGTGLGLLHAYDGASGKDIGGFPKHTGGWLFAPAALSTDGRTADITREGYLFEWNTGQSACQPTGTEWPTFRHDPHDSGNFNVDATPPATPASVTLTDLGHNRYRLSFLTPGDDGFCGPDAAAFRAQVDGATISPAVAGLGTPGPFGQTATVTLTLPAGTKTFSFQAVDRAGNVGWPATLAVPRTPGGTSSGGGRPVGLPPSGGGGKPPAGGGKPGGRVSRPRLVLVGHTAFGSATGDGEVAAACFGHGTCLGALQMALRSGARTVIARGGVRVRAGDGGYVHLGLTRAGRMLLIRGHGRRVVISLSTSGAIGRHRLPAQLASYRGRVPRISGRRSGSAALRALGVIAFVDPSGEPGILVGCESSRRCAGQVSLRLGSASAGGSRRFRVAANSALFVHFRLVRSARRRLAQQLALRVTLTVAGTGRQRSSLGLVPFR